MLVRHSLCLQHYSVVDRIVYVYAPLSMKRNFSFVKAWSDAVFIKNNKKTKKQQQPKNVLPRGHATYKLIQ